MTNHRHHEPVEVLVPRGQCVIWQCKEPASGLACAGHEAELKLAAAPCPHGETGRCKRCWEITNRERVNRRRRELRRLHKQEKEEGRQ